MPNKVKIESEFRTKNATYKLEWVKCGKTKCQSCPHGPYWYVYFTWKKRQVCRYVGKELRLAHEDAGFQRVRWGKRKKFSAEQIEKFQQERVQRELDRLEDMRKKRIIQEKNENPENIINDLEKDLNKIFQISNLEQSQQN